MLIDADFMLSNECKILFKLFGNFAKNLSYVGMACALDVLAQLDYQFNMSSALLYIILET